MICDPSDGDLVTLILWKFFPSVILRIRSLVKYFPTISTSITDFSLVPLVLLKFYKLHDSDTSVNVSKSLFDLATYYLSFYFTKLYSIMKIDRKKSDFRIIPTDEYTPSLFVGSIELIDDTNIREIHVSELRLLYGRLIKNLGLKCLFFRLNLVNL